MKKVAPVFSCYFYEIFKNISGRLLLSVKGSINYLYRRESCKYDSTFNRKSIFNEYI